MTVRKIDPVTGDIATSGVQFIKSTEEIEQTIRTRLRLFLGEYFRNITLGTPWFQSILGKNGSVASKNAILRRIILQTEGVTDVRDFTSDYDIVKRSYSVSCTAITEAGEILLNSQESF